MSTTVSCLCAYTVSYFVLPAICPAVFLEFLDVFFWFLFRFVQEFLPRYHPRGFLDLIPEFYLRFFGVLPDISKSCFRGFKWSLGDSIELL